MNIIKYYFNHFKETWRQNIIYIGFIVVFLFFAITLHDSGFLSLNNILNIFLTKTYNRSKILFANLST